MIRLFYDNTSRDISPLDTSYRYRSIMGENSLTLIFEAPEFIEIPVGAYCNFEGQNYTLLKPENFKKQGSRNYQYTLTLDGPQGGLRKYRMRDKVDKQLKFSLTAKPQEHLQLLVDNLNEREAGWAVGEYLDASEKVVSYNHTTLDAALQQIAEAFDTEWEIKGKVIHLRKVEYNKAAPLALSYGKGNGFRPGVGRANTDNDSAVEILFVQGGDRNINWSDYGSRELLLPRSASLVYEGRQYVTDAEGLSVRRGDKALEIHTEGSLDCSHIYPSRVGVVSEVLAPKPERNLYDFLDDSIPADLDFKACLIAGQTLTVKFETGILAGREFDVDYKHADKRFLLVPQEVDGVTMPNETFKPAIGDKYAVFGMQMPDQYICDNTTQTGASWDMFREAVKYLYEHENPRFSFTGEMDGIWAKQNWLNVGGKIVLGGYVRFSDPEFQPAGIDIRIVGIRDALNNPFSPVIELSNAPAGVTVASELKKIKTAEVVVNDKVEEVLSFTKRRYRETLETMEMLQGAVSGFSEGVSPLTVQTMSLIVGSEALQFRFVTSKTEPAVISHAVTFDPGNKIMTAGAGIVQHMTIGIDTLKSGGHSADAYAFWDVSGFASPPLTDPAKKYYLYIKASKTGTTGVFHLSETAIKLEDVAGYYHFLVGFLNSESDGERSFARMHGFTEVLPGRITTAKIHADTVEATQVLAEQIYATGAEITGNLLVEGTVDAEKINVKGLFAEEIIATDFTLGQGMVGNFEVNTMIKSVNSAGEGIYLDPEKKSIDIESVGEGGSASVRMRVGDLSEVGTLRNAGGLRFAITQDSAPVSHFITSNKIRAQHTLTKCYAGRQSETVGKIKSAALTSTEKIPVTPDRNYVARFNYLFAIQHNGGSSEGKKHKLYGSADVFITATLRGETGAGTIRSIYSRNEVIKINRSDNSIMYDEYPLTFRTAFNSKDGSYEYTKVWWEISGYMTGNLTYQERDSNWLGQEWWSGREGWEIEFQMKMGANSDFQPSVGVTEITTSGFQTFWAENSYFRVNGKDSEALIRSAGKWMHNGVSIATINDVTEAVPDLTPYVLWNDLTPLYYTKSDSDGRYARKGNANTFTANQTIAADLLVQGNIIQQGAAYETHAEQVFTKDDFIIMRDGAVSSLGTGLSGFKIKKADGTTDLILGAGSDAIARVGWAGDTMQAIATREDSPTSNGHAYWDAASAMFKTRGAAFNSDKLGGYAAGDYPRKGASETITGAWSLRRAGTLGGSAGNFHQLHEIAAGGGTANNIFHREWAYRRAAGSDWQTWNLHDGISVDSVYATPRVSTRVWYERNPNQGVQMWGNAGHELMRLTMSGLFIGSSAGTNPSERLHVDGRVLSSIDDIDGVKSIRNHSTSSGGIEFGNNSGVYGLFGNQNRLAITKREGTANNYLFHINRDTGNVAIGFEGDVSAAEKLDVNGSIKIAKNGSIMSGHSNDYILKDHGNANITLSAAGGDLYLGYQKSHNLRFYSGSTTGVGTEKMRLLSNGNLGIGNFDAPEKLTVAGNGLFKQTSQGVYSRIIASDNASRAIFMQSPIYGDAYATIGISGTISNLRIGTQDFPDALKILNNTGQVLLGGALEISGGLKTVGRGEMIQGIWSSVGLGTGASASNHWQKVLSFDWISDYTSESLKLAVNIDGAGSGDSITGDVQIYFKSQGSLQYGTVSIISTGSRDLKDEDFELLLDKTNRKVTLYHRIPITYMGPVYSLLNYVRHPVTWYNSWIGTSLSGEISDDWYYKNIGMQLSLNSRTDQAYFKGVLVANNDLKGWGTFRSGFTGENWMLERETNHLTVDNLTVRQGMKVYELDVQKVTGSNGSIAVTNSAKIDRVTNDGGGVYTCHIDTDTNERLYVPFRVGDFIKIQNFNGKDVKYFVGEITATTNTSFTVLGLSDTSAYLYANSTTYGLPTNTDYDGGVKFPVPGISGKQILIIRGVDFEGGATVQVKNKDTNEIHYSATMTGADNESKYYYHLPTFTGNDEISIFAFNSDGGSITYVSVRCKADYNAPASGDVALQWGHKSDTSRQGLIYLTNSDDGAPYIDVLDGISTVHKFSMPGYNRLRIGKLDGVGGETGYGIRASQDGANTDFVVSSAGYAKIAGWEFNTSRLRSANQRLHISNQYNLIGVTATGTDNPTSGARVLMHYSGTNNWGIYGTANGVNPVFQLGAINQIAGWSMETDAIGHNTGGNSFIAMVNNVTTTATIAGGQSYLRRGFGMYNYDTAMPTAGGVKIIRIGMLTNKDSTSGFPATPNLGIQIGTGKGSAYKDVFRVDDAGAIIAGWQFDHQNIRSANDRLHLSNEHRRISLTKNAVTHPASGPRVQMYYNADNDWGLWGSNDGTNVQFSLGSSNRLAGWFFDDTSMSSENSRIRIHKTHGIVASSSATTNNVFGNDDRINLYYISSSDWGIIGRKDNKTVFQLGAANRIAGITFDDSRLYTDKWELNKNGNFYAENAYITGEITAKKIIKRTLWAENANSTTLESAYSRHVIKLKYTQDTNYHIIMALETMELGETREFILVNPSTSTTVNQRGVLLRTGPTDYGKTCYVDFASSNGSRGSRSARYANTSVYKINLTLGINQYPYMATFKITKVVESLIYDTFILDVNSDIVRQYVTAP